MSWLTNLFGTGLLAATDVWPYLLLAIAMFVLFALLVCWLTEDELKELDATHAEAEEQRHAGAQPWL